MFVFFFGGVVVKDISVLVSAVVAVGSKCCCHFVVGVIVVGVVALVFMDIVEVVGNLDAIVVRV